MKNNFPLTTGIGFTDKAVKLVQSDLKLKRPEISSLEVTPLANRNEEEIAKGLSRLLKGRRQKDLGRIILSIPRHLATLHCVKLPSTKPEEIKEMSRLQAAKQIPYDPEEIILGERIIRTTPEGYSDVILIIVHQDTINKYLSILQQNKIEPQEITIDSEGISRWFGLQKESPAGCPVMIVDLDCEYARLDILYSRTFIYSRAFNLDVSPIIYKQRLNEEIQRSLIAYQKDNIAPVPGEIFFTGAGDCLNYLDQEFLLNFASFSCVKYPQEQNINLAAPPRIKSQDLSRNSFASLLGITLSPERPDFNLLPEHILNKKGKIAYQRELRKTAFLLSAAIAAIITGIFLNLSSRKQIIHKLNRELSLLSADASRMETLTRKLNLVKGRFKTPYCLDILAEIFRITDDNTHLVSFAYNTDKSIVLKGQAKSMAGGFALANKLEESPLFKGVGLQHSSKRKSQIQEIAEFEIICQLEERE